jgi:sugar/nucleoside kinase (ribokinase family)
MRISGVGCCVVDLLYELPGEAQERLARYLTRVEGDGGLIRGGAVLKSAVEALGGGSVDRWVAEVVGDVPPHRALGGVAVVSLIAAAQLLPEAKVRFYSNVSDDDDGDWVSAQIARTPLSREKIRRRPGRYPTTVILNERRGGHSERTFICGPGAAPELALRPGELDADFFRSEVALFGAMWWEPLLHAELFSLLEASRRARAVTVVGTAFDPARSEVRSRWRLGDSDEVYRQIDVLVMDHAELLLHSGEQEPSRAREFFQRSGVGAFLVTDGVRPVYYWSGGGGACAPAEGHLPIAEALVGDREKGVLPTGDSVGCGDNFLGGVAASVARQREAGGRVGLREAALLGCLSGGIASTHAGGVFFERRPGEKLALLERYRVPYLAQLGGG